MAQALSFPIIVNDPDTAIFTSEPSGIHVKRLCLTKYALTFTRKIYFNNMPPNEIDKAYNEFDFQGAIDARKSQTII